MKIINPLWCTDEGFILDLQNVPEEFEDIARYLQGPLMDDDFRRHLEGEEQLDYIFEEQAARHLKELAKKEKEKLEERKLKEAAEEREQEANKQREVVAIRLARQMKKNGATLSEIALETGLPIEDVEEVTPAPI